MADATPSQMARADNPKYQHSIQIAVELASETYQQLAKRVVMSGPDATEVRL
jgi:hypothetical protein